MLIQKIKTISRCKPKNTQFLAKIWTDFEDFLNICRQKLIELFEITLSTNFCWKLWQKRPRYHRFSKIHLQNGVLFGVKIFFEEKSDKNQMYRMSTSPILYLDQGWLTQIGLWAAFGKISKNSNFLGQILTKTLKISKKH
jgi:hypothetical protein